MSAAPEHHRQRRLRSRLLALVAASSLAVVGLVTAAPPASAAPSGDASASPTTVARFGTSTVTLTLDGETSTQSTPTDLVLVLDESGSISSSQFAQLKAFSDDIVEQVALDGLFSNGGRIGVVGFAGSAQTSTVLPLNGNETTVRNALAANPQSGGQTCIACAVERAALVLGGDQPTRNQLVIVITDGNATERTSDTASSSNALQAIATVFAVGVGSGISQATLDTIASGPGQDNTFSAANFDDLAALLETIVAAVTVPGATNPRFTVSLASGWDLVTSSATASTGTLSAVTADGLTWSRADLGDEVVTVTYDVTHEGTPCGLLPVNSSVVYSDDEGSSVTFPAVAVTVACQAPTADAGPDLTVSEGSSVALDGTGSSDPDGVITTFAWSGADALIGELSGTSSALAGYTGLDDGTDTVDLQVVDDNGLADTDSTAVTVTNIAPSLTLTSCPIDPNAVGSAVSFAGGFTDPGTLDTHTVSVSWGDGTVTGGPTSSSVGDSHVYSGAGIYDIAVTVTDDDGGTATQTCGFVVVYDPNGGFVTGGGWINSPAGAYPADPDAAGRANFGFVSKYKKGATVPTGSTEFQFKAGDLNFHSDAYDWLVVAGSKAQYKGTGTVNGVSGYGFMLTATDGSPDRLRMKIWRTADDTVVYDNQIASSDTANPTTALSGGSIVVHRG